MEKPWKTMENHGKNMEKHGKPWKTMENHGKNMEKHGKPWKTMENHGKNMEKAKVTNGLEWYSHGERVM